MRPPPPLLLPWPPPLPRQQLFRWLVTSLRQTHSHSGAGVDHCHHQNLLPLPQLLPPLPPLPLLLPPLLLLLLPPLLLLLLLLLPLLLLPLLVLVLPPRTRLRWGYCRTASPW